MLTDDELSAHTQAVKSRSYLMEEYDCHAKPADALEGGFITRASKMYENVGQGEAYKPCEIAHYKRVFSLDSKVWSVETVKARKV